MTNPQFLEKLAFWVGCTALVGALTVTVKTITIFLH
jgi:hypothetical protein